MTLPILDVPGETDSDAQLFLSVVSYRRERVRREGEWQPSGVPHSEELDMALYLIAFNDEWTPDLTLDELRQRARPAGRSSMR